MVYERTGETEMIRPTRIFELLGKVSDGTFLNKSEFNELETYIRDLEMEVDNLEQLLEYI
jgi:hypothetical protein